MAEARVSGSEPEAVRAARAEAMAVISLFFFWWGGGGRRFFWSGEARGIFSLLSLFFFLSLCVIYTKK